MDAIGLYTLMFTKSDTEILEALNNYNYATQNINLVCPAMPLHQAILTRRRRLVEILLNKRDGPIDVADNYNGLHPLHCISEVPISMIVLSILKANFLVKYLNTINTLENYITTSVYIEMVLFILQNLIYCL